MLSQTIGLLFLLEACTFGQAQIVYRPFPIDGGGAIQCLAVSPSDPNLVLVGVDVAGVARSTDGGQTWTMCYQGLLRKSDYAVADIAFCPSRPNRVYAAVGNTWIGDAEPGADSSLMVSEDTGKSWTRVSGDVSFGGHITRQRGKILIVDSKDPLHLWAGTTIHGVLETHDGGKTWTKRGPENVGYINVLICDSEQANRFYLGASGLGKRQMGLWISDDAGRTWNRKLDTGIRDIVAGGKGNILAVGGGDVRLSRDYGQTWRNCESGLPRERNWDLCAGADPFQAGRFLIAAETGEPSLFSHPKVFLLDRPEGQWRAIDWDVEKIFTPYGRPGKDGWQGWSDWFAAGAAGVVFHPTIKNKVYLADWYAVNQSLDGGLTWKAYCKGLYTTVPLSAAWDRAESGHIYMGMMDIGFMEGWVGPKGEMKAHSLRDVVLGTHASPAQFVFGDKIVTLAGMAEYTPDSKIFRRVGQGNWARVFDNGGMGTHRPGFNHEIIFAADEKIGNLLAILVNGWVVRSTDEGKTWSRYQDSLLTFKKQDEHKIGGVAFHGQWQINVDGTWYQARKPGQWSKYVKPEVMYSADGSVQYRIKHEEPMKNADELLKSTDSGKTWTPIYRYPWCKSTSLAVSSSKDVLWVFYNAWETPGIAVSVNGGKDWKELPRPPGYQILSVWPDPLKPTRAAVALNGMGFWLVEVPN